MTDASRTEIELYWHSGHDTAAAYLLSPTGKRSDAQHVAKALADAPADTRLLKVDGQQVERGVFHVEDWKLRDLGWENVPDERQGSLFG